MSAATYPEKFRRVDFGDRSTVFRCDGYGHEFHAGASVSGYASILDLEVMPDGTAWVRVVPCVPDVWPEHHLSLRTDVRSFEALVEQ